MTPIKTFSCPPSCHGRVEVAHTPAKREGRNFLCESQVCLRLSVVQNSVPDSTKADRCGVQLPGAAQLIGRKATNTMLAGSSYQGDLNVFSRSLPSQRGNHSPSESKSDFFRSNGDCRNFCRCSRTSQKRGGINGSRCSLGNSAGVGKTSSEWPNLSTGVTTMGLRPRHTARFGRQLRGLAGVEALTCAAIMDWPHCQGCGALYGGHYPSCPFFQGLEASQNSIDLEKQEDRPYRELAFVGASITTPHGQTHPPRCISGIPGTAKVLDAGTRGATNSGGR